MNLVRVALLVALVAVVVGWYVFIPRRPSPAGPHAVGRMELVLKDREGRPLQTTVWYPAEGSRAGSILVDAPLAGFGPAPLVLYSPGWGATRSQSSIQLENLASHGFVVVGCDSFAAIAADDPDHGKSLELATDTELAETIERGGRHVVRQASRIVAVLDALADGQAPFAKGRLDLAKVGVLGYSAGGGSALQAGLEDPRIVAIINVDGALFGPPADRIGPQAYFLISSQEAFPPESELKSADPVVRNYALLSVWDIPRNERRMRQPGNYWVLFEDADHDDLSDGLFTLRRSRMFRTNFKRRAMNDAIGSFEVAFFRSTLTGDSSALKRLAGVGSPSFRWINPASTTR